MLPPGYSGLSSSFHGKHKVHFNGSVLCSHLCSALGLVSHTLLSKLRMALASGDLYFPNPLHTHLVPPVRLTLPAPSGTYLHSEVKAPPWNGSPWTISSLLKISTAVFMLRIPKTRVPPRLYLTFRFLHERPPPGCLPHNSEPEHIFSTNMMPLLKSLNYGHHQTAAPSRSRGVTLPLIHLTPSTNKSCQISPLFGVIFTLPFILATPVPFQALIISQLDHWIVP